MSDAEVNRPSRALDVAVRAMVLGVVSWVPLRVIGQGYLPPDDALRHAAKAVSGRPWGDIVLLRPEFTADPHAGWHALLGALYAAGWSIVDLVWFSVVSLFVVFSLGPALLLRRAEAWLIALLLLGVAEPFFIDRWLVGRPLLLSAAVVPLVCLTWSGLTGPRARVVMGVFAAAAALVTWIHGSFYLLALPLVAVAGARRWAAAARMAAAFAVGIAIGACLTGDPLAHLQQILWHAYLSVGAAKPSASLATELQPFDGKPAVVAGFLALVAWRAQRRGSLEGITREPAAVMTVLCWALGYVAHRFWIDWGAPALLTLAAMEIEDALASARSAPRRAAVAAAAGVLVLLQTGADLHGRWTDTSNRPTLSRYDPGHSPWLPDEGGILYSSDMAVFYSVFFANPHARWKYILGFEPALMPPAEYEIYRGIKESRGSADAYLPWVRRMRPEDRLILQSDAAGPPPIGQLEWAQPAYAVWSGRVPRRR